VGITMKYAQRNDHPSKMGQPSVWKYLFQPGHTTRSKTSLYKCYNNAILDSITESGLGSHLGTISVAAPTCADDITHTRNFWMWTPEYYGHYIPPYSERSCENQPTEIRPHML
jgi:hypothetical protein